MLRRLAALLPTVLLVGAGLAFALLGAQAIRLEREDGARRKKEQAASALSVVGDALPFLASQATATETLHDDEGPGFGLPPRGTLREEEALLAAQAEFLERTGDGKAAFEQWKRLATAQAKEPPGEANSGSNRLLAIARVRAGVLALGLGLEKEGTPLLESVIVDAGPARGTGPPSVAWRHLSRLPAKRAEAVRAMLDATQDGSVVRLDGEPDGGDLLLALASELGSPADLPAGLRERLEEAATRARRGHRIAAALRSAPLAVVDGWVARHGGNPAEVLLVSPRGFADLLSKAGGHDISILEDRDRVPEGALTFTATGPLAGLRLAASPAPATGTATGAWLALGAGLASFTLAGAFATRAARASARAVRMQSDFVAAVSHEMKTPIAGVQAMAEMLAEGRVQDAERARTYAERIQVEMARLGSTVRNVLDAARIERDPAAAVSLSPTDPADVVRRVADLERPVLERRGFRFTVETVPGAGPIPLDPEALAHVLNNLIDNAAKFSDANERDRKEIELRAGPGGRGYRVEVADRGPGVPAADREKVFERFYRGEEARRRAVPGVGLGLHVARELVQALRGEIRVEEREGGGARFVVELGGGTT